MKKLLLLSVLTFSALAITNCSNDNDETEQVVNNFENADYIKGQMIGKWNYWGHKSPSCNCWAYSGDYYKWYFEFKSDNTYKNKSLSSTIESGTYTITPATKTDNAILYLNYKDGSQNKQRKIILKALEGKSVTIYESSFDERYDKE